MSYFVWSTTVCYNNENVLYIFLIFVINIKNIAKNHKKVYNNNVNQSWHLKIWLFDITLFAVVLCTHKKKYFQQLLHLFISIEVTHWEYFYISLQFYTGEIPFIDAHYPQDTGSNYIFSKILLKYNQLYTVDQEKGFRKDLVKPMLAHSTWNQNIRTIAIQIYYVWTTQKLYTKI